MTIDRKILCYQKPYVLYGIIAMSEFVYRSLWRDDRMPNFIFRSIVKFDFGKCVLCFELIELILSKTLNIMTEG